MRFSIFERMGEEMPVHELAKKVGITSPTIYHWQKKCPEQLVKMYRLAKELGCTIDELIVLEEGEQ